MTEHIALPLRESRYEGGVKIKDANGKVLATIHPRDPNRREIARFIVTACNCHANLLETLERFMERHAHEVKIYGKSFYDAEIDVAKQTIRKVEEQGK